MIFYAVSLCHAVQVWFGSDPLPELFNTCELSVATLSAGKGSTHGAGEARWAGQLFGNSPATYERTSVPCSGKGRRDRWVCILLVKLPLEMIMSVTISVHA